MNKISTTIEQSQKLIEFGVDINTADMYWLNRHIDLTETKYEVFVVDKSNKYVDFFKSYAVAVGDNEIIPCWSLAALLEQLHYPSLHKTISGWRCDCYNKDGSCFKFGINAPTEVDAAFEMIELLHKENLL